MKHWLPLLILLIVVSNETIRGEGTALWLFDEQEGLYPSSGLSEARSADLHLALGRGGEVVPGKFGNALRASEPDVLEPIARGTSAEGRVRFGLEAPPIGVGRTVDPLTWENNRFAALFTSGDAHLRRRPFQNATESTVNIGSSDWTVEFWFKRDSRAIGEGVVFELGSGPRGENDKVTRLTFLAEDSAFRFENAASGSSLILSFEKRRLGTEWTHCAFVFSRERRNVTLFLDGESSADGALPMKALPFGEEAYFSVARDGLWNRPLRGAIDELRFSDAMVYREAFNPPASFSSFYAEGRQIPVLKKGPSLLFPSGVPRSDLIEIGSRRHLFLDEVLVEKKTNIELVSHPSRIEEIVLDHGIGWATVLEDENGLIRIYGEGSEGVAVWTSRDGLNFEAPDMGRGKGNEVIPGPARRGTVFIDPNGPDEERWKAFVGLHNRGGWYLFTSPDGWSFTRHETAALPFWPGSASTLFYDDQRQVYVGHHRSDYGITPAGNTERFFVRTERKDLKGSWPFEAMTRKRSLEMMTQHPVQVNKMDPWWLDNGPLAPPGFGIEFPIAMGADPNLDPLATDLYNTRAMKYPWADDAYVAFPLWFFHYHGDGPETRQTLHEEKRGMGTGLVETQLAVSRDGLIWDRHPRPAYIPVGDHDGYPVKRPYILFGMARRGDRIFQYSYTRSSYHDSWDKNTRPAVVHRLSQRLDGFISLRAPYTGGEFLTRTLRFEGDRLVVNIDTGATGFAQVGVQDANGKSIDGYAIDECVYINTNSVDHTVEWLETGTDLSALAGKTVRLQIRMRGTDLYALQFKKG
jgi:hypothetical protein